MFGRGGQGSCGGERQFDGEGPRTGGRMPFKSDKQKKYMFANMPKLAKKWSKKYGKKPLNKVIAEAKAK